jgi:hypothetical protein
MTSEFPSLPDNSAPAALAAFFHYEYPPSRFHLYFHFHIFIKIGRQRRHKRHQRGQRKAALAFVSSFLK